MGKDCQWNETEYGDIGIFSGYKILKLMVKANAESVGISPAKPL